MKIIGFTKNSFSRGQEYSVRSLSLLENGSLSLLIMVNVSIGLATAVPVNRNVYKIYIRAGTDVLDIEVPLAAAIENAYIDGDYWRSVKRPRTSSYNHTCIACRCYCMLLGPGSAKVKF